jgi:hypothetical protein
MVAYGFDGWPVPTALYDGFLFKLTDAAAPENPSFLLGQWSYTGWPWYYLAAMSFKLPLAFLGLIVVGIAGLARRRLAWPDVCWISLPPLLLIYALSIHYRAQFGVRYLLPAIPFLILIAGAGVAMLIEGGRWSRYAAAALSAWLVLACVLTTPHQLAYFNELAGPVDGHRHVLLDSNLDWGQDLGRLGRYLADNEIDDVKLAYFGHADPAAYGIRYSLPDARYAPGVYAISANYLGGYPYAITYGGAGIQRVLPGQWAWLDRFEPTARVGRSIWIYDLRESAVERR